MIIFNIADSDPVADEIQDSDDSENCGRREQKEQERKKHNLDFLSTYNQIRQQLWNLTGSINDLLSDNNFVLKLQMKDTHGCSMLHHAAECGHTDMVKLLVSNGTNPNAMEKIGLTPVALSVIKGHIDIVKLMLDLHVSISTVQYDCIQLAGRLGHEEIVTLLVDYQYNQQLEVSEIFTKFPVCFQPDIEEPTCVTDLSKEIDSDLPVDTMQTKVPVFGDNGVEKLIRSVKAKSGKYDCFAENSGDLHTSGYVDECIAKCLGPGGMYFCLEKILCRKSNAETFGKKKFQDGNLQANSEACRDICYGYALGAFLEFKNSEFYPTDNPCESSVLLNMFKQFLTKCKENDKCKYHLQAIDVFGPLFSLYKYSVHFGFGTGRETVWLINLIIFAQMKKKNYFAAAFCYCVNFLIVWSSLIRELVKVSFSVSVTGKTGHNIAADEYVETYMVKPLKMYATGHTSFQVLQRLSVCTPLFRHIRSSYVDAFHSGKSKVHKVPDFVPDQVKVALFVINENFFKPTGEIAYVYDKTGKTGKCVQATLHEVMQKGSDKVKKEFSNKMYNHYPAWRRNVNVLLSAPSIL